MQFMTYISSLPKKYQAIAEDMSNDIQEDFNRFYKMWREHYIESKDYWAFSTYIGHETCLRNRFGPENSDSKKYYISFTENGRYMDFYINYKKRGGKIKRKRFSCVIFDPKDWYFPPKGERRNNSN